VAINKIDPDLIGFDIDGVVADTAEAFLRIARTEYGLNSITLEDITEFEVEKCLAVDPAIIEEIFARLLSEPVECGLQPMPHAAKVLTRLAADGHLNFVTARPDPEPIAGWLAGILGPEVYAKTRLDAMGEHDHKARYVKNMGLRYFVDDRAETCILLDRLGIMPLVYNQPWNIGKHNLPTVDNWLHIWKLCCD